jgi:hypothetical protein
MVVLMQEGPLLQVLVVDPGLIDGVILTVVTIVEGQHVWLQ